MIDEIKDYVIDKYYKTKHGFKNLIVWFPVIWKDRNYDDYYLLKLIDYKLNLIAKEMKGNFVGADDEIKIINSIREVINRIITDDYCQEEWEKHKETYGELIPKINKTLETIDVVYSKVDTKEKEESGNKELYRIINLEEERKRRDIEFVFNNIRDNIRKWWV